MHRKKVIALFALSTLLLSGCALEPQKQTEPQTETEATKVILQETELQTEAATEPQTEKNLSLKDIQVSIEKGSREGTVSLQLTGSSEKEISQSVLFSSNAFYSSDTEGNGVYMNDTDTLYGIKNTWKETDGGFVNLLDLVYSDDCVKQDDADLYGTPCYHLSYECEDTIGALLAYCRLGEYRDVVSGSVNLDYYINKETFEFVRIDVSMSFLGTAGDGTDAKGDLSGSFTISGKTDSVIVKPKVTAEEVENTDAYTPGEILADNNVYQNQQYGIQILGRDLLNFDSSQTETLKTSYTESGSRYQEEAYGSGDGVILNISSVPSNGSSTETVIEKYLSDSNAVDMVSGENVSFAGVNYATATASINNTATKTYATGMDGRVLLITLYYTDESSIAVFEGNVYNTAENPLWEATTWQLEGKYQVTTPSGYSIVQSESGDLYCCMASTTDEINIFALEGSSISTEVEKETVTGGDTTREIREQEEIALNDSSVMSYYKVYCSEPNLSYYTYVGLLQKDTAVIKFYAVSSAEMDYKTIYTEAANGTSIIQQEAETELSTESATEAPAE